jgi:hypothetical protein
MACQRVELVPRTMKISQYKNQKHYLKFKRKNGTIHSRHAENSVQAKTT